MRHPARKTLYESLTDGQRRLLDEALREREMEQIEELVATSDPIQFQARVKEVREIRELFCKKRWVPEEGAD